MDSDVLQKKDAHGSPRSHQPSGLACSTTNGKKGPLAVSDHPALPLDVCFGFESRPSNGGYRCADNVRLCIRTEPPIAPLSRPKIAGIGRYRRPVGEFKGPTEV